VASVIEGGCGLNDRSFRLGCASGYSTGISDSWWILFADSVR